MSDTQCKSILVADDNDDVRLSLIAALRRDGYEVAGARHGREALTELRRLPSPVLVLLDMMMPIMNGWEFVDAKSKSGLAIDSVIVTISAVNPDQSTDDEPRFKAAASLQKPVSLKGLRAIVRKFCAPPGKSSELHQAVTDGARA